MNRIHDVLVVGSGPAGISACWPLTDAGVDVLLVDPGSPVLLPSPERPSLAVVRQGHSAAARYLLGEDLRALRNDWPHQSPKLRTAAPAGFLEGFHALHRLALDRFVVAGALATGGLSNVWGGVASAFDDRDLKGTPLRAADLAASYRAVVERIGVSGSDDDMGSYHGAGLPLQPPLPLGAAAGALAERYAARRNRLGFGFALGRSRHAVLTQPHLGREACTLDNYCMWGCARRAIYNSAYEIPHLVERPGLSYLTDVVVDSIERLEGAYRVHGRNRLSGAAMYRDARTIVLAAGTLGSTKLVLDHLGRREAQVPLLNNPGFGFAMLLPQRLGAGLSPNGFAMAELSFALPVPDADGACTGLLYSAEGVAAADLVAAMPLSMRGAIGVSRALAPAMMLGLGYLPGEFSRNVFSLRRDGDGTALAVRGGFAPEFDVAFPRLRRRLGRIFAKLGAILLPGSMQPLMPGGDSHYAGTLPMGQAVSADCEVIGANNLFVVDGSVFGRLPAKHLTLTIMANADRVARILARRLGRTV